MKAGIAILVAVLLGLAGLIAAELQPMAEDRAAPQAAERPAAATAATAAAAPAAPALMAAILARPLFSAARRPPAGTAAAAAGLPRLTGVTVGDGGRWALFAGEAGGRGLSVPEGGGVGAYVVRSVSPGQVVVDGPGGVHTLRPGFAGAAAVAGPEPAAAGPAAVPVGDLLRNGAPPRDPTPGLPRLGPPAAGDAVAAAPGQAAGLDDLLRAPMRDIGVPGVPPPSQQSGPR